MVTHIKSFAFSGINVVDVDVQVQISPGVPTFTIVGLADKTIAESKERVKAALVSMGLSLPSSKILVNLAPADLLKEGSHFDLPIAAGILTALGILPEEEIKEYVILGELSLDGTIFPVSGALPAAMGAVARNIGVICPEVNGKEAAWSGNDNILAPKDLINLVNHFKGTQLLNRPEPEFDNSQVFYPDFSDIIGQETAKRALEVAAAGNHNLLMFGPPGTGKSMLAQRLSGILTPMVTEEVLECSTIYSVAGLLEDGKLTKNRPFRAPHHSCSLAAMVGGGIGKRVKPGEISLAHNGVLFLDELPEFPQSVIESLRQPIENREVLISRANSHIKFPADFQLIAAMNPCKCGYLSDPAKACAKAPRCGSDYQNKISGPILDRFDINIEVASIDAVTISKASKNISENSKIISERVARARAIQSERYEGYGIRTNSRLDGQMLLDLATPSNEGLELLNKAAEKFKLSMRAYNRILKVSRTIADLDESKGVSKIHISEAINYRIPELK